MRFVSYISVISVLFTTENTDDLEIGFRMGQGH